MREIRARIEKHGDADLMPNHERQALAESIAKSGLVADIVRTLPMLDGQVSPRLASDRAAADLHNFH